MLSMLIVPAASALPSSYFEVIRGVEAHGYDITALHIPSIGLVSGPRQGSPPDMYDDAAFIATQITKLADAGNDILLITHSYGGTPGTQSIKGLSKVDRAAQGKKGGVVGIAYMTSLVPEVGSPASSGPTSPLMEIGEDGWFYYPDRSLVAKIVFSDIPVAEGEYYATKMVNHSAASFRTPLTYAGYKDVPISYLVAEGDQSIAPERQRSQIAMIEKVSGKKVDVTTTKAGHVPSITATNEVVNWIISIAVKLKSE